MTISKNTGPEVQLGVSPLSWSNDVLEELGGDIPLEVCLKEAAEIGYEGVELGRKFPRTGKVLEQARRNDASFNSAVREGMFTVPGDGDIDFSEFRNFIRSSGYSGWVVVEAEQDPAKAAPRKYTEKAYQYSAFFGFDFAGGGLGYFDIKVFKVHDLIQGIGRGAECFPDFEFGARNQEILEAIDQSSRSGRWVSTVKAPSTG